MTKSAKISLFLVRVSIGWLFFYAGITKVLNPDWTAAGYLKGAKTFSGLYAWFGSAANIGWVDFLNEWGLTLVGAAIILGLAVRFSSICGILLMALYYLPILNFPLVGEHSYLVDEHIIYILVFAVLASLRAGQIAGLDKHLKNSSLGKNRFIGWIFS